MILAVLSVHVAAAFLAADVARRNERLSLLVALIAPLATTLWLVTITASVLDGEAVTLQLAWVERLGLAFDFRLDELSLMMAWLVAGIGVLVFWYAYGYFDSGGSRLGSFAATLVLFAGSMLGLVLADNVFTLFLFWELTSVTSFLLVGYKHTDDGARASAMQALLITGSGGIAMLGGLVMLSVEAGTSSMSEWLADPPRGPLVPAAVVLVLLGAITKSAQVPLHFWLPGAMAAPTPVSAYLHSATMVKAGVYLVARLAPIFATVGVWRPIVLVVGSASMVFGGVVALRRHDLKQILAYGTISQLGFLMVLLGAGVPALTTAGLAMLFAHGIFKASLFMVVGIVDHSTGTRDIRRLGGLGRSAPLLAVTAVLSGASMAGVPPMLGFASKEKALAALLDSPLWGATLTVAVVVVGSVLTFGYTARALWAVFGPVADGSTVSDATDSGAAADDHFHRPGAWFVAPAAVAAVISLVVGIAPFLVNDLVQGAAQATDPEAGTSGLKLWPGVNLALALSGVVIAGGVALFAARRPLDRMGHLPNAVRGEHLFSAGLSNLLRLAGRTTRIAQPGSLPHYLAVVILTAIALPGFALLAGGTRWPAEMVLADTPIQLVVGIAVVVAACFVAWTSHRLSAALALGAVGFGVAVLFVIEGAPDLALTQLLVETAALVAFVLVLRRLPDHYPQPILLPRYRRSRQVGRFVVSAGLGLLVFALAVTTTAVRRTEPVGTEALARSYPDGGGSNTVNVILSDFRALDTLGEITVVAAAVIGVMAFVRTAVRRSDPHGEPTADPVPTTPAADAPWARSMLLDVGTELIFHTVFMFGLYLLFAGHNRPGGGFIAGLVIGAAFVVRFLAAGSVDERLVRIGPARLIGAGVALATGVATVPLLAGRPLFDALAAEVDLPLLGTLKLSTVLGFEIGVVAVVVGLVSAVLLGLGRSETGTDLDDEATTLVNAR